MQTARTDEISEPPAPPHKPAGERLVHLLVTRMEGGEDMAAVLRQYGFKCRTFVNGEVLQNAGRIQPPRAVIAESSFLSDQADGTVANTGAMDPSVPLICIADDDSLDARVRAIRGGADAFLVRPLNRFALLHAIQRLVDSVDIPQRRCLLVANNTPLVEGDTAVLKDAGISVSHLEQTEALFSALDDQRPDLLLINDDLNEYDSLDVVQAVRQEPRHEGLPVLLLTRRDKRLLDERASAAGLDGLVGLPVNPQDLAAIIHARTKRAESVIEAYRYLAKRDPVTGLFNRHYFMESLRNTLALGDRRPKCTALIYLHLNDDESWIASPLARDGLLIEAGEILRRWAPPLAVPARLDDRALAILVFGSTDREVESLSSTLGELVGRVSTRVRGETASGGFQVGCTVLGTRRTDPDQAVGRARRAAVGGSEAAGHEAPAGKDPADSGNQSYWKPGIEEALEQDRFRLVYQPIASLSGHPTPFYEVFMRMLDEDGNDILPQEFLPAAERSGLTGRLDRWVIARALHVLVEQREGKHKPVLFVKLFGDTIDDGDFPPWLHAQFESCDLAPERLVFEMAQRTISTRRAECVKLIGGLKAIGCKVAVEHYGRHGEAPLALQDLGVDYLKLAGDVTADIGINPETQKLVQRITREAKAAGTRSIASLVQDATNLSALWRCGVEYIQGYFMQEPADIFAE